MKRISNRLAKARLGCRDQDGFNLLGAIIMVSLVVLVTFLVTQSQGLTLLAKRSVRAAGAYEEIIQPFQSAVVEKLRTHFSVASDPGCPTGAAFASGMIGQNFRFDYAESVQTTPSDPDSMSVVKTACGASRFQDGRFKFCLGIHPTNPARVTDNNMSSMSDIIAELDISLWDVQDNRALTCSEFYRGKSAYTVRVDYTLHWLYLPKSQSSALHKKRRGSFYAIL